MAFVAVPRVGRPTRRRPRPRPATAAGGDTPAVPVLEAGPRVATLDADQTRNARAIVQVATRLAAAHGMDADHARLAAVIGLMTALQESSLHVIAYGDAAGPDSRGLFQQRDPWGPLSERMDAQGSARLFYDGGHGGQSGPVRHRRVGDDAEVGGRPGGAGQRLPDGVRQVGAHGGGRRRGAARRSGAGRPAGGAGPARGDPVGERGPEPRARRVLGSAGVGGGAGLGKGVGAPAAARQLHADVTVRVARAPDHPRVAAAHRRGPGVRAGHARLRGRRRRGRGRGAERRLRQPGRGAARGRRPVGLQPPLGDPRPGRRQGESRAARRSGGQHGHVDGAAPALRDPASTGSPSTRCPSCGRAAWSWSRRRERRVDHGPDEQRRPGRHVVQHHDERPVGDGAHGTCTGLPLRRSVVPLAGPRGRAASPPGSRGRPTRS